MKFDKPHAANAVKTKGDVLREAREANARAIFEDPASYAEWRIRMGLERKPEPPINYGMRERVLAEFRKLGVSLAAIPDKRARPVASDALRALNMRKVEQDTEKSLPF